MDDDPPLDPNRFATGAEAEDVRARAEGQRAILAAVRATDEVAQANEVELYKGVMEIQSQYNAALRRWGEARAYARSTQRQYRAQLHVLAVQSRLLHPIRKLPLEILGLIFEYCLLGCNDSPGNYGGDGDRGEEGEDTDDESSTDEHHDTDSDSDDAQQKSPFSPQQSFLLAAVCRRWRDASLATPRAWSFLHVSFDDIRNETLASWRHAIKCVLKRSANVLLDISVTRRKADRMPEKLTRVAKSLADAMQRCRTLRLAIDTMHDNDYIALILRSNAPNLTSGWMHTADTTEEYFNPSSDTTAFPGSPKLRNLNCSREFLPALSHLPSVKMMYTKNVEISGSRNALQDILAKVPNVSDLHLSGMVIKEGHQTARPVEFMALDTVRVDFTTDFPVKILGQLLRVPNLRRVVTFGDGGGSCFRRLQFIETISTLSQLQWLAFSHLQMGNMDYWIEMFGDMKRLSFLKIEHTSFARYELRTFCAALTEKNANMSWCHPKLVDIILRNCTFSNCDEEDIISCVRTFVQDSKLPKDRPDHRDKLFAFSISDWHTASGADVQEHVDQVMDED